MKTEECAVKVCGFEYLQERVITVYKETNKLRGFYPRANYTDWTAAACRRNLLPTFVDRGVWRGQRGGSPTVVNLSFIDRSRYFFFQVTPHLSSRG
jgi:hypothetical protein